MYLSIENAGRQSVVAAEKTPGNADDGGGGHKQLAQFTQALMALSPQKRLAVRKLIESLS